jgi:hypothetical protein
MTVPLLHAAGDRCVEAIQPDASACWAPAALTPLSFYISIKTVKFVK